MNATRNDRAAWLKGGSAQCSTPLSHANRPLRLVLLGAPGSGKGTQAELLGKTLGGCQLSTGDIFRSATCSDAADASPAVRAALQAMAKGELVSDETVLNMVKERVRCLRCLGGILLDGFPRTVAQAEALSVLLKNEAVKLDAVISYELPLETIVARLGGRRTCGSCKAVFHVETKPPAAEGVCDHCGGKLLQREDDRPEAVRVRMEAYGRSTAPLADYYRKQGLLLPVAADGSPEDVLQRTLRLLANAGIC